VSFFLFLPEEIGTPGAIGSRVDGLSYRCLTLEDDLCPITSGTHTCTPLKLVKAQQWLTGRDRGSSDRNPDPRPEIVLERRFLTLSEQITSRWDGDQS
jgi:hypothetical protein